MTADNIDFKYKVKKRKAVRIEQLPPLEAPANAKEEHRHRIGPLGIYEPFTYDNYEWKFKKEANRNRDCCVCGNNTASYVAYFQLNECQRVERYCLEDLKKWVYLDESVPIIGK